MKHLQFTYNFRGGSRTVFRHPYAKPGSQSGVLFIDAPHPQSTIKRGVLKMIADVLGKMGVHTRGWRTD